MTDCAKRAITVTGGAFLVPKHATRARGMFAALSILVRFLPASGRALLATVPMAVTISCGSDGAVSRTAVRAAGPSPLSRCEPDVVQILTPDPGAAGEAYLCYGFSVGALVGSAIQGVLWQPPQGGGVMWHHATLSAVMGEFPDGPVACDGMPANSVSLHVWTPGGDDLALPDGVALALPVGTTRLALEMHAFRVSEDGAQSGSVGVCARHGPIRNVAGFVGVAAPVPAIRPQSTETSSVTCTIQSATHLWSVWPHMHHVGSAVEATLRRGDGRQTSLNRVDPWDFYAQRTYPLDTDVDPGDQLVSQCWWKNPTRDYVFPGLRTTDEMCNEGFIGWPSPEMQCVPGTP